VKLYVRLFTFFSKSKKHDFLRIVELLHTFSRTLVWKSGALADDRN